MGAPPSGDTQDDGGSAARGAWPPEPSAQQLLLLRLTAAGQTADELGAALDLSRADVQAQLRDAMWRLGARNMSSAIDEARRRGLIG